MGKHQILFLFIFIFLSCNKYKDYISAIVIDSGDITRAGCGYLLKLGDGSFLKPVDLPTSYQQDGRSVKVKYHTNGRQQTCTNYTPPKTLNMVVIDDITGGVIFILKNL